MIPSRENVYVAVLEDDESLARSMSRLLRASGIQTVTYSSADSFLADKKQPQFDCYIFDIQLGGTTGIKLRNQLKAEGSQVPVILLTAREELDVKSDPVSSVGDYCFKKTVSGEVLLAAIWEAIENAERNAAENRNTKQDN